jgi:hypothetical protein
MLEIIESDHLPYGLSLRSEKGTLDVGILLAIVSLDILSTSHVSYVISIDRNKLHCNFMAN